MYNFIFYGGIGIEESVLVKVDLGVFIFVFFELSICGFCIKEGFYFDM